MLISDKSDMSKKYVNNVFFLILWKQKKIFEKDLAKKDTHFQKVAVSTNHAEFWQNYFSLVI